MNATAVVRFGWLSPQGALFENGFAEHTDNAYHIFETRFPERYKALVERQGYASGEQELTNMGWIRIGGSGAVTDAHWYTIPAEKLTQAQVDWLADEAEAAEAGGHTSFATNLRKAINESEVYRHPQAS